MGVAFALISLDLHAEDYPEEIHNPIGSLIGSLSSRVGCKGLLVPTVGHPGYWEKISPRQRKVQLAIGRNLSLRVIDFVRDNPDLPYLSQELVRLETTRREAYPTPWDLVDRLIHKTHYDWNSEIEKELQLLARHFKVTGAPFSDLSAHTVVPLFFHEEIQEMGETYYRYFAQDVRQYRAGELDVTVRIPLPDFVLEERVSDLEIWKNDQTYRKLIREYTQFNEEEGYQDRRGWDNAFLERLRRLAQNFRKNSAWVEVRHQGELLGVFRMTFAPYLYIADRNRPSQVKFLEYSQMRNLGSIFKKLENDPQAFEKLEQDYARLPMEVVLGQSLRRPTQGEVSIEYENYILGQGVIAEPGSYTIKKGSGRNGEIRAEMTRFFFAMLAMDYGLHSFNSLGFFPFSPSQGPSIYTYSGSFGKRDVSEMMYRMVGFRKDPRYRQVNVKGFSEKASVLSLDVAHHLSDVLWNPRGFRFYFPRDSITSYASYIAELESLVTHSLRRGSQLSQLTGVRDYPQSGFLQFAFEFQDQNPKGRVRYLKPPSPEEDFLKGGHIPSR